MAINNASKLDHYKYVRFIDIFIVTHVETWNEYYFESETDAKSYINLYSNNYYRLKQATGIKVNNQIYILKDEKAIEFSSYELYVKREAALSKLTEEDKKVLGL